MQHSRLVAGRTPTNPTPRHWRLTLSSGRLSSHSAPATGALAAWRDCTMSVTSTRLNPQTFLSGPLTALEDCLCVSA